MSDLSLAATDRVAIAEGVTARPFDGEWIVLDLQRGSYYGLDELGGCIWKRLLDRRSPQEIATELAPTYDVPEQVLLHDILELVGELLERGLVRIST